jgi:hypothetical protein
MVGPESAHTIAISQQQQQAQCRIGAGIGMEYRQTV